METAHKRPNYILIWVYLAVLTAAELALAFELPISRNLKLLLLLFLATWKAALVGLFFMHLKFERWNLRIMALIPLPLALIFILAGMSEHIWYRFSCCRSRASRSWCCSPPPRGFISARAAAWTWACSRRP